MGFAVIYPGCFPNIQLPTSNFQAALRYNLPKAEHSGTRIESMQKFYQQISIAPKLARPHILKCTTRAISMLYMQECWTIEKAPSTYALSAFGSVSAFQSADSSYLSKSMIPSVPWVVHHSPAWNPVALFDWRGQ